MIDKILDSIEKILNPVSSILEKWCDSGFIWVVIVLTVIAVFILLFTNWI